MPNDKNDRKNNELVLSLKTPKVVLPAVSVSTLTIERIVDLPGQRIVRAFARELNQPVVLWQGDAYDKIGDWTQALANARILEIVNA